MSYTAAEKETLAALFRQLAAQGEISPSEINGDYDVVIEYSESAKAKLAGCIAGFASFAATDYTDNFFTFEFQAIDAATATRTGLTTGIFNDSWTRTAAEGLTKFMREQAMMEIIGGEIFTARELWGMVQHSPKWRALSLAYQLEMRSLESDMQEHGRAA